MLRQRNIVADVKEDIKLLHRIPLESVFWAAGSMVLGVMLLFLLKINLILGIIITFLMPVVILVDAANGIHTTLIKRAEFKLAASKEKWLDTLSSIKTYGTICETKTTKKVFLEKLKVAPWEVCPDGEKDRSADQFAEKVYKTVKNGVSVSIYGISSPERTTQLEERLNSANTLPEGLKKIENSRIEYHYSISQNASSTRYIIALESMDQEKVLNSIDNFENTSVLGGDVVKDLGSTHLTPGAKQKRGKQEFIKNNLKVCKDMLLLNDIQVKTFLISDFPREAVTGLFYLLTHEDHADPGVVINFAIHFKPSTLKLDWKMTLKLRRLDRNIKAHESNKDIADYARKEEKEARDWLLYLRSGEGRFVDAWAAVTISSADPEKFKTSVENFKNMMENKEYKLNELEYEQYKALDFMWMGGGRDLFERYYGRVMDTESIAALYPFLDGTVSDGKGAYMGHRVKNATTVYQDLTSSPDGQDILVTGTKGGGKSTLIKGIVQSLLNLGFKGYIPDVDGEYRDMCEETGVGVCVDYTTGSGRYVDSTFIEKPLMAEIDPYDFDERGLRKVREADAARFYESIGNTFSIIGLLCDNFDKGKENALDDALMQMWADAGIKRDIPETWEIRDKDKIGLKLLFERIKHNAKKCKDSEALYKELKIYFEGSKSFLFSNADDGDWIKNARLVVYYIGSAADNIGDPRMNAIKIISTNHMTWQQIKRDRIKKKFYSFEVKDELQRSIRNPADIPALIRSATTNRKFNNLMIAGFNDPSILFNFDGGEAIWENSKYKIFFPLTDNSISKLSQKTHMPEEVIQQWQTLDKYEYIYSKMEGSLSTYDVLKIMLPENELALYQTRGLN